MTRGRPMHWFAVMLCVLLAACGGAAGDAASPPPSTPLPEIGGRVDNGHTATNVLGLQITVKGNVGTARTAEGRKTPVDGKDYLTSLDQISGPYLLADNTASTPTGLYSVATGPGIANLTPLTTLLVAELLGADPGPYFDALGMRGGFTAADQASVAAAEQRVRRYLQREHGFTVPASLGPFVTTRFERSAGDPMHDTLTALVARLGTDGDISAVVRALAQESARCKLEKLVVSTGDERDDFCPFARRNEPDPADAAVRVIGFDNRHGDRLLLRLRGPAVLDLVLTTAEGAVSRCTGSACRGITIGTSGADQRFEIGFDGTVLAGGGAPTLTGRLQAAAPGIELPGLPCTANRFYLIDEVLRSAEGYCATGDDFGLGTAGQSLASGATRRRYTFNDGAGGPSLEVVVQGSAVASVLVYATDAATGAALPRFRCVDAGCTGASLGAPTVDQSLGVPVVLQPIRLERAVLAAVQGDGSITVEAGLTGFHVDDPNALPMQPLPCAAGAGGVAARPSDEAAAITVCEPADTQGFTLRSTSRDAAGRFVASLANLLGDGAGSVASGNTVTVTFDAAGTVLAAGFDGFSGVSYRCSGTGCSGITASAPDALGGRRIGFSATTLTEVGTGGLIADRTLRLDGSYVAPAVP